MSEDKIENRVTIHVEVPIEATDEETSEFSSELADFLYDYVESHGLSWQPFSYSHPQTCEESDHCAGPGSLVEQHILARAALSQPEPEYQYQVFDTKRSRKVMDIPTEDVPETEKDLKNPLTPAHWVLRRRVVGEWEDVK